MIIFYFKKGGELKITMLFHRSFIYYNNILSKSGNAYDFFSSHLFDFSCFDNSEDLTTNAEEIANTYEDCMERQQNLMERLDVVLKRVKTNNPVLSKVNILF